MTIPPAALHKAALAVAAVALLVAPVPAETAVDPLELTDPADTALALAISNAADAATEAIGGCRAGGGELAECLCTHRDSIGQLRVAVEAALAEHPEWTGLALFVADMGDGRSLNLFMDTASWMATEPDCD